MFSFALPNWGVRGGSCQCAGFRDSRRKQRWETILHLSKIRGREIQAVQVMKMTENGQAKSGRYVGRKKRR
jgi:hypothetical protein